MAHGLVPFHSNKGAVFEVGLENRQNALNKLNDGVRSQALQAQADDRWPARPGYSDNCMEVGVECDNRRPFFNGVR